MKKHTILFLAANPSGTDRLALDREARAIQVELERSGYRDCFELETRWAAEPLDLLRELRKLRPTVIHFSGHGDQLAESEPQAGPTPRSNVVAGKPDPHGGESQHGLFFHGADGRTQVVSTAALEETIEAAGTSVQLVVLSACYSEVHAAALLAHVDCVVGMSGSIDGDAARSFAIGFYGGLGERESVAAAYKQGCAAIRLDGLRDADRPQLKVRVGVDAGRIVLAGDPPAGPRGITHGAPDQEARGPGPRQEPGGLRRRLRLATGATSLLLATSLILSTGARRTACRVPGLRSLCAVVGIGDVSTPAEQALWDQALAQDSENGLQAYLQRYPTGVHAEEARSRLDGCQLEETLGPIVDVPFDLRVPSGHPQATEDAAHRDALERGNRWAGTVCEPLKETDVLLSAQAEPQDWTCLPTNSGITCQFDGKIVCRVQKRIKSKHCRPRE